ncbi:MAG: trypsin-like peptidase domain-containing protein [Candidatus Absconditabacteria bacterium]
MSRGKLILTVLALCLIINLVLVTSYFWFLTNYGIIGLTEKLSPEITRVIDRKIVSKSIEENIDITDLQNSVTKAIEKASPAVVSIIITKELKVYTQDPFNFFGGTITDRTEKVGGGSGIIVTSDGYIVTNKHVVEDTRADYSVVTNNGDSYQVDKIRLDPVLDIAVLKILDSEGKTPNNLEVAQLNNINSKIRIGQFTIAIGNALAEYKDSATFGILSGKGRSLDQGNSSSNYIGLYQTDAPINPGNSGGPLLDVNGNVIGINTAITSVGQGIGFAIPVNKEFIQTTLSTIEEKGIIERPFIGIQYMDLNKSVAKSLKLDKFQGVYVQEVIENSPASAAGIKKGDIIRKIQGKEIDDNNSFFYELLTHKTGDKVQLTIFSNGEYKNIDIILAAR